MSGSGGGTAGGSTPGSGTTEAQQAFGKYKARLAGGPMMMMPPMPGWAMPPSMGPLPFYPPGYPYAPQSAESPHPSGSLSERLGATLRLGVDLLNAALASGAHALGGGMAGYGQWDAHGCECSCCNPCGYDCCAVMGQECCRPGAHGCGCCC